MFNFDQIGRVVISAIGALILTSTVVGAAVGPARVAETTPVVGYELTAQAHA